MKVFHEGDIVGDYKVGPLIGKGGMAQVYQLESNQYHRFFAGKVIMRPLTKMDTSIETELTILLQLDHKNIVRLYDYRFHNGHLLMILDLCPLGSMANHLFKYGPLSTFDFISSATEILQALAYMHSNHIAHRDIKPANILVDTYGHLKLTDFGISKQTVGKICEFGGSFPFLSPEILERCDHDPFKSDMWSLGVTFYFMLTGELPWNSEQSLMEQEILFGMAHPNTKIPKDIWKIIISLLDLKPNDRPSAAELLENPLFRPTTENLPLEKKKSCIPLAKSADLSTHNASELHRSQLRMNVSVSQPKSFMPKKIRLRSYSMPATFAD